MITLRPYQEECIERIRAVFRVVRRRVLLVLPTGGGKTIIFAFIVLAAAERSRRVCILVHRRYSAGSLHPRAGIASDARHDDGG